MADIQSNIQVNIDTSEALASIKALQRQISAFHTSMAKSGAAANAVTANMQQNLLNAVNATGKWQASFKTIQTTTESFTDSLEKNKFTMREYFRYAGASTRTFGKLFKSEFDTIGKVSRERVKDLQTQYIKLGRDANGAMKSMAIRPLALNMKDYGTQVQIASQRQQILNQLLKQGSTNLLNFGKNTQWAGRQLMVGFTIPLAYLGTAASRTFMKLEEQAIRFKRVYGELFTTSEETNEMLKDIELLAKEFTKYGVAVEKTMSLAADAAAQGKMGADLLAQINEGTRLAVLGGVEQEEALKTTISLTNAFGIAAQDLAGKIDFLNAVENQTVVSIEDLTIAIPKAGPVVQQLGGDVEDLAFFLTAMKEGGINASEGANALKSGLASLINPTGKASEMLAGFGINIKGIVEANKGNVKGIVTDFASALDTLDPLNRAQAIEQLFGKFQFSRLSTLFQNVIAEGNQASRVLELTKATTEELAILSERELGRIEESSMYKFKKSVEDLKVTLAPIGEEFLRAVTPVAQFVSNILEKFNNLGDGTKKFIVILTTLLGAVGPIFLMTFGLLANGLANIIKLFASVKGVFNRAGASSKTLGQQTDYMSNEQMQAAAIAASLEQVHARLIQTFTSEASAVNALTAAYRNAIAAQTAFTGPIRAGVPGPKKFNRGTTQVKYYARGTDTVPAMLTPGEAVIPAGPAQNPKNKKAIATMVAGGVVGYAGGTVNVGGEGYGLSGGRHSTLRAIQNTIDASIGQIDDILALALKNLAEETKLTIDKFKNEVRSLAKQQGVKTPEAFAKTYETRTKSYSAKAAGERRNVRTQLVDERGAKAASAEMARANAAAKAIEKTLKEYGATTSQIANATQIDRSHMIRVDNEQKKILKVWHSNVWTAQTGAENNAILDSLRKSSRYREVYKEYLIKTGATEAQVTSIMTNINNGVALTDEQLDIQGRALRRIAADAKTNANLQKKTSRNFIMYSDAVGQAALARSKVLARQPAELRALTIRNQAAMQQIANELPNAAAVALQTKSPSRRMRQVGQEAGAGIVLGAKEYVDDARVAGQQLGAAATTGVTQGGRKRRAAAMTQGAPGQGHMYNPLAAAPAGATMLPIVSKDTPTTPPKTTFMQRFADRRAARAEAGKPGMGAGGAMMAASGVMMAASMAPGQVGEMAQKLIMPMMGLTMVLPLLQSKIGLLTIGIASIIAAAVALRMSFDKAQDAAMKLTETLGSGTDSVREFSKFANTVSAGEIMQRRRESDLTPFAIKTGKSTFGSSFVESEQGKGLAAGVGQSIKELGRSGATSQLVNQLATSVAAGALTAGQARSIVASLGKELGDYGFAINVNGRLTELLGPNGENLAKDPLSVRVKLLEDTRAKLGTAVAAAQQTGGFMTSRNTTRSTSIMGGLGAAGGGALGAMGAGALAGTKFGSRIGAIAGPKGMIAGAALGAGIGAVVGAGTHYFQQKERQKELGTASGAQIAMTKIAMQQQQEMLDSLDIQFEKEMEIAKAKGDQETIDKLQNKYIENRIALLEQNKTLMQDVAKSFESAGGDVQSALITGVDKAITKQYKGTAMEDVAGLASTQIGKSAADKTQQYQLKVLLSTGSIDPMQMVSFMESFGQDKGSINKILSITTKFGAGTTNQMAQVAGMFVDKDGKPVKSVQTKFMSLIEAQTDSKEAESLINFYAKVAQTGNVLNTSIITDILLKNPKLAAKLQNTVDQLTELKGPVTIEVATKILNAKALAALNEDLTYFSGLNDEEKKIYLQTLAITMSTVSPDDPALKAWLSSEGSAWQNAAPGVQLREYAQWNAQQVTETSAAVDAPKTPAVGTGDKKGPDPSSLDPLLQKLKEVQKNQIKVTEGWSASMKALREFAQGTSKTNSPFSGLTQDMLRMKTNIGGNFIDFILGMDPKEYERRKKEIFKFDNKGNIIGLQRDGKIIKEALTSITAGEFQAKTMRQNAELNDQAKAFNKLQKMGVPVAEAYNLISDASFANMIATMKNKKKVKELVDQYKEFLKLAEDRKETEAFGLKLEETKNIPKTVSDQQVAISKLMSQGASFADAYNFVQDAAVAAAVAGEKNINVLRDTANAATAAAEATKKLNIQAQFYGKLTEWQESLETIKNQKIAISKLVAAGFNLSDAYSVVQDAAVAATIAQSSNNTEIRNTANLAKQSADALKAMAAAQNLVIQNQQVVNQKELIAALQANKTLTNAQIKAILENQDLATIFLKPEVTQEEFDTLMQALQNAANSAELELSLKKLTIEGMEDIFNDGYSKAMEAFDAEEKAIELKFKSDTSYLTDPETGIIPVAENAIAQIQYQIDDWEAGLKGIEEQEKAINESYDEKTKALEEVQKINEKISRQQKQQLGLADALSRGDISAAAMAIQEMRESNAADQSETQKQMLDAEKENRLANVRNALGQTRKQIEDQIKKLKDQIFEIEEKTLEPAREALRLRERQRDIDVSNVTVLGRTRTEWEGIKNGIDLAKTRSDFYKDAIQAALDIVKDIVDYWTNKVPKEVTTVHKIITKYETEGAPPVSRPPANEPPPDCAPQKFQSVAVHPQCGNGPADMYEDCLGNITFKCTGTPNRSNTTPNTNTTPKTDTAPKTNTAPKVSTPVLDAKDYNPGAFKGTKPNTIVADAKKDYDKKVVASLKPGASPSDFGAALAAADKKVVNAIKATTPPKVSGGGGMTMSFLSGGGMVKPKYFANGAFARGTDTIPAMLTPGEFVVKKSAVDNIGINTLNKINDGIYDNAGVYNYNLNVTLNGSDMDPNEVASVVIQKIKQLDSQKIRRSLV